MGRKSRGGEGGRGLGGLDPGATAGACSGQATRQVRTTAKGKGKRWGSKPPAPHCDGNCRTIL